jgi:hypothetical protein
MDRGQPISTMDKGEQVKVNVRIFVALALFTLALSGAALAQDYDQPVRATIPFSFYADGALQPAGTYTFAINLSDHSLEMLSGSRNSARFLVGLPEGGTSKDLAILTFRTDGQGVYVLQKVQWSDFGVGFNVKRQLARAADVRSLNATQTVIAQLR